MRAHAVTCADDRWSDDNLLAHAGDEEPPDLTPAQLQQIRDLVRYGRPVTDHPGIDQYQP
jgi:hypothetical protein